MLELDDELFASLQAAFATKPQKLQRLEKRIAHDKEVEARLKTLEQRIVQLHARNTVLRKISPPPLSASPLGSVRAASAHAADLNTFSFDSVKSHLSSSLAFTAAPSLVRPHDDAWTASTGESPEDGDIIDDVGEASVVLDTAPIPDTWGREVSPFRYVGPSVKGTVSAVIGGGVLYRILTEAGDWAFYNDTRYYLVTVRYRVPAAGVALLPGPSVTVRTTDAVHELSMQLWPEETRVLWRGTAVDAECLSTAALLPKKVTSAEDDAALCAEPHRHWSLLTSSYPAAAATADHRNISVEQLLSHCIAQGMQFVDPRFFPSHRSLYREGRDTFYVAPLHWRSPFRYLPDNAKVRSEVRLFRGPHLNSDGLRTGHLFPNFSFLSAVMGLVCCWPKAIRRLFLHTKGAQASRCEQSVGAYRVTLCFGGWWKHVVVDSFLPAASYAPEFSRSADDLRVLWLLYLEKACAKSFGSYAALLDTSLEDFVGALTGGPCRTLRLIWPTYAQAQSGTATLTPFVTQLTKLLRPHGRRGLGGICWLRPYSITSSDLSRSQVDLLQTLYSDLGLHSSVATVLLGLETLRDGQGMARLRQNAEKKQPTASWLARWAAQGKPWVEEVSELIFAMDEPEGRSVWMALEDLPRYFQGGCIAPQTDGWAVLKVRGRISNRQPSLVLQIMVSVPARVLVSVARAEGGSTGGGAAAPDETRFGVKTGRDQSALGCLVFSSDGHGKRAQLVGGSSASLDAFELAEVPQCEREADSCLGHLLDPGCCPYYVAPSIDSPGVLDVAYTFTVAFAAAVGSSMSADVASARVRFMTPRMGETPLSTATQPLLRVSSLEMSAAPLHYQSIPLRQSRLHDGTSTEASFSLLLPYKNNDREGG